MSTTDDVAERVLPAAFAAQADHCADPQAIMAAVRGRTRRQRSTRPALTIAAVAVAVAAVVGISATVASPTGNNGPAAQQVAPGSGSHPGMDQLSGTCLDMEKVTALWASDSSPYGGVGTGDNCSQEADAIQATHPEVTATVNAGGRKVYLASAPDGILAGFIALTPAESAAAVQARGNTNGATGAQYLIVAIPDDNPQEVLISILTQYQLPS